jgi:uncharacterized cysteine cluster protein YcgN (CxxCxxCC family)
VQPLFFYPLSRYKTGMKQPEFTQKPMHEMTEAEWESLCDGCGLCCQIRVEDEDTGEIAVSNVACKLLCLDSHQCMQYEKRKEIVPDCIKATPDNIRELNWLPASCAYRLVAFGQPLPKWHYLICGDRSRVHTHGPSMMGSLISELEADWDDGDEEE